MIALAGAIVFRRHLNNLFPVPLMGQSLDMIVPLPIAHSALVWALLSTAVAFALMALGGYAGVERRAKGLIVLLMAAFVLVAVMARPSAGAIAAGLFAPTWPAPDAIVLLMALAASSVGSINHLKDPAFVYEKGWRDLSAQRKQRVDLALSCLGQLAVAALIQIAVAATLKGGGAQIKTAQDLSGIFSTHFGETGRILFAITMWAAVFSSYIGSNTGYSLIVADVYERFLRRGARATAESRDAVRQRAYLVFLTFFCVSPLYVLVTSWEPFWIGIVAGAIFFAMAPLLMTGVLVISSNRGLMREQASGWLSKTMIGLAIALSLAFTYRSLTDLAIRIFAHRAS
jgi:Mn2+/Fe2+ NRAMP family transporter